MNRLRPTGEGAAFFVALMATAVALGGALAHALELINKMQLDRADYFTVQQIYAGWNLLAIVLLIELAGIVAVIVFTRGRPAPFMAALVALGCLIGAQAVFWTFTFPANAATDNWTVQPDDWDILRRQWEYSHLAGAVFQLFAMAALVVAALKRDAGRIRPPREGA